MENEYDVRLIYLIAIVSLPISLNAQLSPGDLAKVHEHLEGNLNCTQCHILGEKVSDDKCLSCHLELKSRINQNKGFHASAAVKVKNCASCHSDHHGKGFQIVRFDEKSFDHKAVGYELTGKHARIDCKACHRPAHIVSDGIRLKKYTYLGLDSKCLNCHEDAHQNTLSKSCSNCHSTEAFVPASNFQHQKTKYNLLGKHKSVDCKQCHPVETRNGEKFQRFSGIAFSNCSNCHTDVHKKELGLKCNECHTEESFQKFIGNDRFNHTATGFFLKGKHKSLDCSKCHNTTLPFNLVFQDRKGIKEDQCISCHKDIHEGKFGIDCKECHSTDGFRKINHPDKFDHNLTNYKLEGKHQQVDCKLCHKEDFTKNIPHETCASCHKDFHDGQFYKNGLNTDCASCHTVQSFSISHYTIEQHQSGTFPLTGAHEATACSACHLKESKWTFTNLPEKCVGCHQDVHGGYINQQYDPNQNCTVCHQTDSWQNIQFDHSKTGYQLKGAHSKQACMNCHGLTTNETGHPYKHFNYKKSNCTDCHNNVHGNQFEINGITNCVSCHGFENWKAIFFNHDSTAFKLEGKHKEVSCGKCHRETLVENKKIIQFKIEKFECVDCHR